MQDSTKCCIVKGKLLCIFSRLDILVVQSTNMDGPWVGMFEVKKSLLFTSIFNFIKEYNEEVY